MIRRPPSSTLFPYPPLSLSLDLGAEARHGRPAGLAQRDDDDGDQDDRQGWTPQIQSLPGRSWETLAPAAGFVMTRRRSEEHTSELQSLAYLVCRLLLEKKKK